MSDIELIKKAKNGDNEAIEKLLNEHKQLVNFVTRKYFLVGGDNDDLLQEGMIALCKAINSYDETKGVSFATYAKTVIEHTIINAIKSDASNKNILLNNSYGLTNQGQITNNSEDDFGYTIASDSLTPESQVISTEQTKDIVKQIKDCLSDYELKILKFYLKGLSYTQIATELGVSSKSVDNALNRIKNKLNFLKENN